MGGGPLRDSGSASTGGRTSLPAGKWRLERAAVNVPWNIGQSTYGIAVDSHNRVYFAAGEVYLFDGTKVSTYLTAAEVVAASDAGDSEFDDLDIGPADTLYVLFGGELFTSNAAHKVVRWGNTRRGGYHDHLGVVKTDSLAYVGYDGLSMLMRKSSKNVYAGSELGLEQDCACQDFSIVPSGVFLYEPGCNGSGINRGNIDGSGVGVLFRATGAAPTYANNFICNGRDPLGGFYVLTENLSAGGRLLHFTEDATEAAGVVTIDTTPAVSAAAGQDDGLFAFDYCSVAGAPDGSAYIATGSTLWHAIPP